MESDEYRDLESFGCQTGCLCDSGSQTYRLGILRIIPFWGHPLVHGIVAVAFALIPRLFGFTGIDALNYWVSVAGGLAVVSLGLTKRPDASRSAASAI